MFKWKAHGSIHGSCNQTILDSSLEGRKYREEDRFNKTVIRRGVRKEMRHKSYSPMASLKVTLTHHLAPDRGRSTKREKHTVTKGEDDQTRLDENRMLPIPNVKCWINDIVQNRYRSTGSMSVYALISKANCYI